MLPRANAPCVPPSLNCDDGFCPRFAVDALDTIGAGDSFLAALLDALLPATDDEEAAASAGGPPRCAPADALKRACALGSFVAGMPGATPRHDKAAIDAILGRGD